MVRHKQNMAWKFSFLVNAGSALNNRALEETRTLISLDRSQEPDPIRLRAHRLIKAAGAGLEPAIGLSTRHVNSVLGCLYPIQQ
jgi:hypothetical protein